MFPLLMIYVRKDISEKHSEGFHGGFFMYKCVWVYIRMYICMGMFTELSDMRRDFRMMCFSFAEIRS